MGHFCVILMLMSQKKSTQSKKSIPSKSNQKAKVKAKAKKASAQESDGAYLLKIVMYIVVGSIWLRFADPITIGAFTFNGLPIGLVIGLIFASHDHFQVDRKIEYVVLILVAVLSYFLPTGIII